MRGFLDKRLICTTNGNWEGREWRCFGKEWEIECGTIFKDQQKDAL
jgi:hypothetical protein